MNFKALLVTLALAAGSPALAQSNPGLVYGQIPTAAQWNSYFSAKQDVLNAQPDSVLGNAGGGVVPPVWLPLPNCSGGTNALTFAPGIGFGCNNSGGVSGPVSSTVGYVPTWANTTGSTLAAGLPASTTVNGQGCALGSSCTVTASATNVTVGVTTVSGGTSGEVEFNNAGVLGEKAVTGTGSVVLANGPTISGSVNFTGTIEIGTQPVSPPVSFSSIAALRANTSASVLSAFVSGYYTLADGGEGNFTLNASDTTSSDNGGTIIVDAGNNRWYRQGIGAPKINVKQFGARGIGSSHDDTTAIQAAVTYAISAYTSNGIQATVYFPTPVNAYYVTAPINCTSASVSYGLAFRGDGERNTIVDGELSSAGPIFDWSGQSSGQIVDMMVTSTSSGSLATTAILFASTTASHTNYNNVVERVEVVMTNNSVVAGITAQDSDLLAIDHSFISVNNSSTNAAIAFSGGGILPAGVSSTFQTANATVDQTDYRLTNDWLTGNMAADFTGGGGWTFVNTYAAVIGTVNSDNAIIRLNAPTSSIDINMRAFNLRTENQSSATGVMHAIYAKGNTPVFGVGVYGKSELNINPSSGGDFIKIDNGNAASEPIDLDLDFFTASGAYPLFNVVAGNVRRVAGQSNVTVAPTMASSTYIGSWSHTLIEAPDISTFLAAHLLGHGENGNAGFTQRANLPYDARVRYMLGVSGSLSNVNGYNYGSWWTTTAYTGGSGTQIVETFTIPAGMLVGENLVGAITRKLEAHFHGSTTQSNTTIGVQLRQGGGTYVLGTATMTSTSPIDMQLTVDNRITAKGIYFSGIVTAGLAPVLNALTTATYGNIDPTSDFYLDITANSAGNNPFNTATHSIVID